MTTVLMTADAVGGVWTYALDLADALARHRVDVVLATMGPPPSDAQRRQLARSCVAEVHESTFPLEWMDDPWDGVDAAGCWLLRLAEGIGADVVHLNGYAHAALPFAAPVLVVAHSDVVSWWAAVHHASPPHLAEYRRRVRAGLAAAAWVVAPTAAVLHELSRAYGSGGGTVIPNGRADPGPPPAAKALVVLSAGRLWDGAKNVAALDRVAGRIDLPVLVAGDTGAADGRPTRFEHACALGALGAEALARRMAAAAIFALPARYEPFGLAALEAGLAGCALVLGNVASLREVWGDAALFVDPDDDDALLFALRRLEGSPSFRAEMAGRARRRAVGYAPERMAAAYATTYQALRHRVGSAT